MAPPRSPPKPKSGRKRRRKRPRKPAAHDHIFRYVCSKPRHAGSLLRRLLPTTVARRLGWSTLELEPGSYVDARLADSASDALFSIRLRHSKKRALVYLLFDHQSTVDRMMPLRLLKYACRAWEDYTERSDAIRDHIPPLIPILLHQGRERWRMPRRLSDLHRIKNGRAAPLPVFIELHMLVHELHYDDLPTHELTTLVRVTLALMKLVAAGDITLDHAALLAQWFGEVRSRYGHDAISALTHYLFHSGQDERIIDAVAIESTPAVRASMRTIAEKIKARGKREGKQEGKLELVLAQLALRFGKLPPHVTRRIGNGTAADLDDWAARLLTAANLDAVFSRR